MMSRPRGILGILERTDYDKKMGDSNGTVRSAIEARRARNAMAGMRDLPSYQYGGQVTSYGVAPELAPLYQNLLEQLGGYSSQTMYGTPQQQAAYGQAIGYGLGGEPEAMRRAEAVLMGTPEGQDYVSEALAPYRRARGDVRRTQEEELYSSAYGQGADPFGGRGQLMQADLRMRERQDVGDEAIRLQREIADSLAGFAGQQQQQNLGRAQFAIGAAQGAAGLPYEAAERLTGITQGMGYQGDVISNQQLDQPGTLERVAGRVLQFAEAYPTLQAQGAFGGMPVGQKQAQGAYSGITSLAPGMLQRSLSNYQMNRPVNRPQFFSRPAPMYGGG
jgi:hypothetical protein